jgi:hypothetical protein
MTMNFRTIKAALITELGNAEAGRYRTIGFQKQGQAAIENLGNNRSVQVFYQSGQFPESAGSRDGQVMHDPVYAIQLMVTTEAKADIATINNPASTPVQVAAAIAAMQNAENLADDSIDELIDIIYQVLMDAENIDIGLSVGDVADRWVDSVQKNEPLRRGEYVVLTASMQFTCSCDEEVSGDSGTAGVAIDAEINCEDQDGNADPGKAGVLVGGP